MGDLQWRVRQIRANGVRAPTSAGPNPVTYVEFCGFGVSGCSARYERTGDGYIGYVRFFEDFGIDDVPLVGGKNASLGEMFQKLSGAGRPRPARIRHHRRGLSPHVGRGRRLGPSARRTRRHRPRRRRRAGTQSQTRQGDRLRRRTPRRPGRPDSGRLPRASAGVRRGGEPRRPELGDRRGPADGELRRPAGFVPQHQGRRESARHLPPLLRQPFHRSRDPLPRSTRASTTSRSRCRSA